MEREKNSHGHWGAWSLEGGAEYGGVSMWVDQGVVMLRAGSFEGRDPVELNVHEARAVAEALLERAKAIEDAE